MKVLVIGANGQIGQILVDQLHENENFEAIAMIRNPEQQSKFEEKGIKTVVGDLEGPVKDLMQSYLLQAQGERQALIKHY